MPIGDFASIKFPPIVDRMGGTAQRALLCPFRDFTTLQEPAAGTYNITTAHVCAATKGFIEVYNIQDSGELSFESIGGRDRRSYMVKGTFEHPGESDEIDQFANDVKNEVWIMLIPLPGSRDLYQIGNRDFQVSIKPSYTTGKNSGDGRTAKFEYECLMANKIKYKAATVPMRA